jgi:uncharacterized protein (DUF433 family)
MVQIMVTVADETKASLLSSMLRELSFVSAVTTHPELIEWVDSRDGGQRPVVRGTQVGVDVIVGYTEAGYTPQDISADILPHLSLEQIESALHFYDDNRTMMEQWRQENSKANWRQRLIVQMGETAAKQLLGELVV